MKTQKINKNKAIKIIIAFSLLLSSIESSAWRVHKHRDKIRFGYGFVQECTFYEVTSNGNLVITSVEINCRLEGDLPCRRGESNISPPSNDLEQCDEFTAVEKTIGINMINDAEGLIASGQTSGSESQTITFVSLSGQSYYRTFNITWVTNTDGSIDSEFYISEPVNL